MVIAGRSWGLLQSGRTLFGFENLMYAFFDDPELIRDVLAHLTELWLACSRRCWAPRTWTWRTSGRT